MTSKLSKEDLIELGVYPESKKVKKIKPNPKSIKPVRLLLKLLNSKFGEKKTKAKLSSEFFAYFSFIDNKDKTWILASESLPAVYSKERRKIEKLIRKKYPEFNFEIKSLNSISNLKIENSLKWETK